MEGVEGVRPSAGVVGVCPLDGVGKCKCQESSSSASASANINLCVTLRTLW